MAVARWQRYACRSQLPRPSARPRRVREVARSARRSVIAFNFEPFTGRRLRLASRQPRVTLLRGGIFGINRAAYELLGEPRAVLLLYDREHRAIGLRPAAVDDPYAHRLTKRTTSESYTVRARRFLRHYEIDEERPLLWNTIRRHEDIVVLVLEEAVTLLGRTNAADSRRVEARPQPESGTAERMPIRAVTGVT